MQYPESISTNQVNRSLKLDKEFEIKYFWDSFPYDHIKSTARVISFADNQRVNYFKLALNENYLYLVSETLGFQIYSISNIPRLVSTLYLSGNALSFVLTTDHTTAFVINKWKGLQIIDLSSLDSLRLLSTIHSIDDPTSIAITSDNNRLFVASKTGISIINIQNLNRPIVEQTFNTGDYISELSISKNNSRLFASGEYSGLRVFDISSHSTIKLLSNYKPKSKSFQSIYSTTSGKGFIARGKTGLDIVSLENPNKLTMIATLDTSGETFHHESTVNGVDKYLRSTHKGCTVLIESGEPFNLPRMGNQFTNGKSTNLVVSNNLKTLYLSDGYAGVHVINIEDPKHPMLSSTIEFDGKTEYIELAKSQNFLYVSLGQNGIRKVKLFSHKYDLSKSNPPLYFDHNYRTSIHNHVFKYKEYPQHTFDIFKPLVK